MSDDDYVVEDYIQPKKSRPSRNDESADLLGNFDSEKRKNIEAGLPLEEQNETIFSAEETSGEETDFEADDNINADQQNGIENETEMSSNLSRDQITILLQGAKKANRFVLYVTNLNVETTKDDLQNLFMSVGGVKSIRIPKKRGGRFAFVEMSTIDDFQKGLSLHNAEVHGRLIKVQISEGGQKKSANKKNILKQKNRKLAEMRNEHKTFNKSGKNYNKSIKKEIAKEMLARKRWRKKK